MRRATSGPQTADAPAVDDACSTSIEPLPATVRGLELVDGTLRMDLRLGEAGAVRPRELLATLGLADLETTGSQIVRTRVEVVGTAPPCAGNVDVSTSSDVAST